MNWDPEPLRLGSAEKGDYVHITWWPDGKEVIRMITRAGWDGIEIIGADLNKHAFFYQDDTEIVVMAKPEELEFV